MIMFNIFLKNCTSKKTLFYSSLKVLLYDSSDSKRTHKTSIINGEVINATPGLNFFLIRKKSYFFFFLLGRTTKDHANRNLFGLIKCKNVIQFVLVTVFGCFSEERSLGLFCVFLFYCVEKRTSVCLVDLLNCLECRHFTKIAVVLRVRSGLRVMKND